MAREQRQQLVEHLDGAPGGHPGRKKIAPRITGAQREKAAANLNSRRLRRLPNADSPTNSRSAKLWSAPSRFRDLRSCRLRVLADRNRFELDASALTAWEAVNARPQALELPGLQKLMQRHSPFGSDALLPAPEPLAGATTCAGSGLSSVLPTHDEVRTAAGKRINVRRHRGDGQGSRPQPAAHRLPRCR